MAIFDDHDWLGDLGSAFEKGALARLVVGLLTATGQWEWWNSSSASQIADYILERKRTNGFLPWGSQFPVADWSEWVDGELALRAADTWNLIRPMLDGEVRLRINRPTWRWDNSAKIIRELQNEFSQPSLCLVNHLYVLTLFRSTGLLIADLDVQLHGDRMSASGLADFLILTMISSLTGPMP